MEVYAYFRREFPSAQIILADDLEGKGKGWAMREGLKQATGELVCFLDGDFDIFPRMIMRLLPFVKDYDIVVGKKNLKNISAQRKVLTILSRIYIGTIFNQRCDTQTGIKIFHRDALSDWETNGFLFDVEILVKAKKKGKTIIEVPIEAAIINNVSIKAVWITFLESLKLWKRLNNEDFIQT